MRVVDGRFELLREAGVGGMGVVYEARDRTSGARVALKILIDARKDSARRFSREAALLAQLAHPGIVRYLGHAERSDAGPYLVMEWLEGEELGERLARGRMDVDEAVRLAARVADAVGAAHARGLVHRDLKPSNVFLQGGSVDATKLLDFGLAREIVVDRAVTAQGLVLGTVGYLSPEQARDAGTVDARTDVFALGCILYECLTGHAAFTGGHAVAILAKLLVEPAPRVRDLRPDVPRELDALVARMLAKDPELRPANGAAVAAALAQGSIATPGLASLRPPALGESEQRVLGVILVGDPRAQSEGGTSSAPSVNEDATIIALSAPHAHAGIERAVAPYGAVVDVAVDGTVVVTLRATGSGRDRAVAAARCALALRAACPGAPIALALGRGLTEGGTAGEVIERAASLLAGARAEGARHDAIHIDDAVASLLDARFVVTAGTLLYSERAVHESTRLLLGHITPFVGRGRELGAVVQGFTDTALESAAGAFVIVGDAGSGKSRLREEIVRAVRRREPDARVWIGEANPLRAQSAFGLAALVLRDAMQIDDAASPDDQRRALTARVGERLSGDDADRVTHFLAEILGCGFDDDHVLLVGARRSSAVMRDQTFRAWIDWIGANDGPVFVALDDLQWADATSVQLFDATLRAMQDRPFMILALARPEVSEGFPRLWAERGTQTIRLAPLADRAAAQLARDALAGAGIANDALVAALVRRAQGNPFVLEELVRARASATTSELDALPEGVLALVQTRLDALDPSARRVLRAASIFGREAPPAGLARLLGEGFDEDTVRAALAGLVEREVLEVAGADGATFVFRHDLVREAAYAALTETDQRLGHRLAGEWLERIAARDPAVTAAHFDRGGDSERAARWYVLAGEQALEACDMTTAEAHANRAFALARDQDEDFVRGRAALVLGNVRRWRGDNAAVPQVAFDAAARLKRGSTAWFSALHLAATAGDTIGEREVCERVLGMLEGVAPDLAAAGTRIVTIAAVASSRLHAGDEAGTALLTEAIAAEAEALAERDPIVLACVHRAGASQAGNRGDFAGELEHWIAAGEAFARGGERRSVVSAKCNAGYGWLALGRYAEAREVLSEALADAERLDLAHIAAGTRHNLGLALAYGGDVAAGLEQETLAIDGLARVGDHRLGGSALAYRAIILGLAGDLGAAEADARAAVAASSVPTRPTHLAILSSIVLARGATAEALAVAREAFAAIGHVKIEGGTSPVRLALAEALFASGLAEDARTAIGDAVRDLEERAARIADDSLRRSFLHDEVTHAKIRARAVEWGVSVSV